MASISLAELLTQVASGAPMGAPGAPRLNLLALRDTSSFDEAADPEIFEDLGFLVLIEPQEESTEVLVVEIIPDVAFQPLRPETQAGKSSSLVAVPTEIPAEILAVYKALIDAAINHARRIGRPILQTSLRHPAGMDIATDINAAIMKYLGWQLVHQELEYYLPLPADFSTAFRSGISPIDPQVEFIVLEGRWDQRADLLAGIGKLWEQADLDVPRGSLAYTPKPWTPQRISRSADRLAAAGGRSLSVVAWHPTAGPIGISTVSYAGQGAAPEALEMGTAIVERNWRNSSLGPFLVARNLDLAPRLTGLAQHRLYATAGRAIDDPKPDRFPMENILRALGAQVLSTESQWQFRLE